MTTAPPMDTFLAGLGLGFALGATVAAIVAVIVHHRARRHWAAILRHIDLAHRQLLFALGQPTLRRPPQPLAATLRARKPPTLMDTAELPQIASAALLAPLS